MERQRGFDAAIYDRLRVLTTELKLKMAGPQPSNVSCRACKGM